MKAKYYENMLKALKPHMVNYGMLVGSGVGATLGYDLKFECFCDFNIIIFGMELGYFVCFGIFALIYFFKYMKAKKNDGKTESEK